MTSPSPESGGSFSGQSEHEKKFDRQIRLWGKHGQKNIENTRIVVLGSGPTASETLKNLVLPNMGEFTIVDDHVVDDSDLGNNFFVDENGKGKPRAEVVKSLLLEMNPDVDGHHIVKNPLEIIDGEIDFFSKYTIVIATQLWGAPLLKLADYCREKHIPLVILKSYGLLGYVRLATAQHLVVESHPENDRQDLYIHPEQLARFPELKEFLMSFDLSNKDLDSHSHIPFVALLVQLVDQWTKENGSSPSGFDEEMKFKEFTKSQAVNYDKELNFSEAMNVYYKALRKPAVDDDVQEILDNVKYDETSSSFWILAAALKRFIEKEGAGFFPVSTDIPDMTTTTASYVKIKELYRKKHEDDIALINSHVQAILSELGLPDHSISESEVAYFVKHCRGLVAVTTRSLAQEYNIETANKEAITENFEEFVWDEEEDSGVPKPFQPKVLHWYFALRAAEDFISRNGRCPQYTSRTQDVREMKAYVDKLYSDLGVPEGTRCPEDCLSEICRFQGAEMHNIAAFVGGVASQLVLKLATKQYKPLNNTIVFDGIYGVSEALEM